MSAVSRPPAGTSASQFFETWLPAAYAASERRAHAAGPIVRAELSGPGGGVWEVRADEDGLTVGAPTPQAGAPDVLLRQTAADFVAAFAGDPDLPEIMPPGASPLDLLFLDPRDADLLRQVAGRILVEVEGRRRRRWSFDVAFAKAGIDAGRPRTTIRVDGATFAGVTSGQIPAVQPLMDGRIKIDGDRALAMQVLLLLGTRLARRG